MFAGGVLDSGIVSSDLSFYDGTVLSGGCVDLKGLHNLTITGDVSEVSGELRIRNRGYASSIFNEINNVDYLHINMDVTCVSADVLMYIITKGRYPDANGVGFAVRCDTSYSRLTLFAKDLATYVVFNLPVALTTKSNIDVIYDGTQVGAAKFAVKYNGTSCSVVSSAGTLPTTLSGGTTFPLRVGGIDGLQSNQAFTGTIDNLSISVTR